MRDDIVDRHRFQVSVPQFFQNTLEFGFALNVLLSNPIPTNIIGNTFENYVQVMSVN